MGRNLYSSSLGARIVGDVILFIAIVAFPWWLSFIFAAAGAFFFRDYYEMLIAGLAIDSLYNAVGPDRGFVYVFSITFAILFVIVFFLKQRLLLYVRE
ncbi:MAG TPA: hypothetical protein VJJ73_00195 [Candidatus Paceibacterota bacterium]